MSDSDLVVVVCGEQMVCDHEQRCTAGKSNDTVSCSAKSSTHGSIEVTVSIAQ